MKVRSSVLSRSSAFPVWAASHRLNNGDQVSQCFLLDSYAGSRAFITYFPVVNEITLKIVIGWQIPCERFPVIICCTILPFCSHLFLYIYVYFCLRDVQCKKTDIIAFKPCKPVSSRAWNGLTAIKMCLLSTIHYCMADFGTRELFFVIHFSSVPLFVLLSWLCTPAILIAGSLSFSRATHFCVVFRISFVCALQADGYDSVSLWIVSLAFFE